MQEDTQKTKAQLIAELKALRARVSAQEESAESRKKIQEAQQKSEERLSLALRAVHDGLWDWDAVSGNVYRSPGWYTMLGYAPDSLPEAVDTWKEHIHPDDFDRVMAAFDAHVRGETPIYDCEYRFRGKDGAWKWINDRGQVVARSAQGQVLRMVGAHRDITERKAAEEALRRHQEQLEELVSARTQELAAGKTALERSEESLRSRTELLQNVLEHVPHAVFWKDRNSVFLGCNRLFAQHAGYSSPEELVGKSDLDMPWTQEQSAFYRNIDRRILEEGLAWTNQEERQQRPDGSEAVLLISKVPLHNAEGAVVGILGIYVDITERKTAENALLASERLFRAVTESTTNIISILGQDGGHKYVSPSIRRHGFEQEELIGHSPLEYAYPDDRPIIADALEACLRNPGANIPLKDFRMLNRDGSYSYLSGALTCLFGEPGVDGILFNGQDVTERKQAEAKIASLARFPSENPNPVLRIGGNGKVWYANTAGEALLDEDRNLPEGWRDYVASALESGRSVRQEIAVSGRTLMVTLAPNVSENYVNFYGLDITEQKRTEEALRENQRRLATLTSNLPGMVYRCCNDAEYTMEFVSDGCLAITGYPPEDLIGNRRLAYGGLIHSSDRQSVWENIQIALGSKVPYVLEYRLKTAEGTLKWVWERGQGVFSADGVLEALEGFILDVTEARKTEDMLRLTQLSVDRASEGIFWVRQDGSFAYVNDAACRSLGYTRDELLQMAVMDIDPNFTQERLTKLNENVSEDGTRVIETQHRTKDGRIIPVEINIDHQETSGDVFNFAFVRDISGRKRAEEERRKLEAQVQHAQKLESLGVLAGGIAHDFNNLLMGILGNADMALSEISPVSPARQSLVEIETAAKRAADLTRQMLAYSGKGRFVVESINLSDVVQEMAHLLEVSISKKALLRYDFAHNLPAVSADATQIRQVIMNLITNASEAIGDKSGVISIATGAAYCDRTYLESTYFDEELPEGFYVFLEVSDTGCGMDQDTLSRIFDPFFTTKFTGRGLGLAAVLGIVRGHRGALKVYTEPGRGTTFKMLLPAHDQPVEQLRQKAEALGQWQGSGTILLVDDEETVRALGKRMLERVGFAVEVAEDGREAIKIFNQRPNDFICVLLDLTMPHVDGEETFRLLRQIKRDVCVVMSSGYTEQEVTQRFLGKGLAGFIQKPYQLNHLREKLREILSARQEQRSPTDEV